MSSRTCTVIVPVSNRAAVTAATLRRLLETETSIDHEIIVVDDGSHDATAGEPERFRESIRVISQGSAGFRSSCNNGAAAASTDYLFFLRNGLFPQDGWLDHFVRYAEAHPDVAVVGGKLLLPNGLIQHAGVVISQDRLPRHIYSGLDALHPAVNKSRAFQCVSAAAMLVRADAFATAAGFDDSFGSAYADADLCLRVQESGDRVHYCHTGALYHLEAAVDPGFDDYERGLYLERWGDRVHPDDLDYYREDGFLVLDYEAARPFAVHVDPAVGIAGAAERSRGVEGLLLSRSRELFDTFRENVELKARLAAAETDATRARVATPHELEEKAERDVLEFPAFADPVVSVVIPVHNEFAYTFSCLRSLLANTTGATYEVILADDASTDETRSIGNRARNVRVVRHERPLGFTGNCNDAARHARGRYIVFLNNDTRVTADWLEPLLRLFKDPAVGVVGGKLVYPTGRLQEAGAIIWYDATGWNYGRLDDPDLPDYNYVREVDYVSGACLAVERALFDEIGGFDERFAPAYFEDGDLAFEARRRGRKVLYQPASVVIHYEGVSHGTDEALGIKSYQVRNRAIFREKWRNELDEHREPGRDPFLARDRPADRRTVLVVDHHVPFYDQDAGGRATYHYLKLFRELGWRVVFVPADYEQVEPYTSDLQQLGILVLYGRCYSKNFNLWLRENGRYLDAAQLHRPNISVRFIDAVREYAPQATIALVPHDLHHLRELRRYEAGGRRDAIQSAQDWWKLEFDLFARTDVIQVFSKSEEALIAAAFPLKTVQTIPLFIADELAARRSAPFDKRRDLLFVGSFGHPPNADALQWFVSTILPLVHEQLHDVRLRIVGSRPPKEVVDAAGPRVVIEGYVPDPKLAQLYETTRVVVAPLRFGAGLKGKIVEAMSAGTPVVTTTVGAEGFEDGARTPVAVADDPQAFADEIVRLYRERADWEELAAAGSAYVQSAFSRATATAQVMEAFPARR